MHKIVSRLIDEFAPWQWETLLGLLEGRAALIYFQEEPFAIFRGDTGHHMVNLRKGTQYTVIGDKCSCPDSRFRKQECKHIQGVKCLSSLAMTTKSAPS